MSSAFNPFDTTSLHIFIRESFSGAVLMEEHQVRNGEDQLCHEIGLCKTSSLCGSSLVLYYCKANFIMSLLIKFCKQLGQSMIVDLAHSKRISS